MLGVTWAQHVPEPEGREIGRFVCPECDGAVARMTEVASGVGLHAVQRAQPVGATGTQGSGYHCYTPVNEERPPAEASVILDCWTCGKHVRIHGDDCRDLLDLYRAKGRKARRPAELLDENTGYNT